MKNKSIFNISKKIVVVTGASGQLGASYQEAFLENGSFVIGLDIIKSKKIDFYKKKYPNNYLFHKTDVTSKISIQKALKKCIKIFGIPDVLVNNAAIDSPPASPAEENGPFEDYPEESWDKVLDVNLKGMFLSCQVFGAAMASKKKGSIINVSSIYGLVSPDQSLYEYRRQKGEAFYKPVAYSASKSGVLNLTKYLAAYWGKSNLRVNSLIIAGVFNNQDQDFLDQYCQRMPLGRMANADEYNGSIIYLASEASSYMTGSNLIIDGGWTSI